MKTIDVNSSKNQSIKEKFVGIHVYQNVGRFIEFCLANPEADNNPIEFEELENFFAYPEYNGVHASFDGGTEEERQDEIDRLNELIEETASGATIDHITDEVIELENLDSEPQEIYEWYTISSYLFDQLREKGQVVADIGHMYIWGRGCTGQAILLDGVISEICSDMEIFEGQSNEWKTL